MKDAFERRRHVPVNFCGRVSNDRSDAEGYANQINIISGGYRIVILLNGIQQALCLSADPEAGSICRYRTTNGQHVVHNGVAQTEIVKGEVIVRLERGRTT